MSKFEESEWASSGAPAGFVDSADAYILERRRMLDIIQSYFTYFIKNRPRSAAIRVLDLGCGDGALMQVIYDADRTIQGTLMDGSPQMLGEAQKRFGDRSFTYLTQTFQSLIADGSDDGAAGKFDFILSSLAIHHLNLTEKERLFRWIYRHLATGGHFIDLDVVLPPSGVLEQWYLKLWEDWIIEHEAAAGTGPRFRHIPQHYQNNPDDLPDRLDDQLAALRECGFANVDCYYKYGIFTVFGGEKRE